MKRTGNLTEAIADWDNLLLAFRKAKKGKSHRKEVIRFSENLHPQLKDLQDQLLSGEIRVGDYHFFRIYDPKEREICAASFPERVMQHALMNVCGPIFEKQQLYESYATRPGKGTLAAIHHAQRQSRKHTYYVKMDIRKYFDSIHHATLKTCIRRKFKDPNVSKIFDAVIDSYYTLPGTGIPIGNLSSQYFANYYLSFFDRFIKQELKIPGYVRYMDDMVLWHSDKSLLLELQPRLNEYVNLKLGLRFKHLYINRSDQGLSFLGFRIFPGTIHLNQRSRNRFRSKLAGYSEKMNHMDWSESMYADRMRAVIAFTNFGDSVSYRREAIRSMGMYDG